MIESKAGELLNSTVEYFLGCIVEHLYDFKAGNLGTSYNIFSYRKARRDSPVFCTDLRNSIIGLKYTIVYFGGFHTNVSLYPHTNPSIFLRG